MRELFKGGEKLLYFFVVTIDQKADIGGSGSDLVKINRQLFSLALFRP